LVVDDDDVLLFDREQEKQPLLVVHITNSSDSNIIHRQYPIPSLYPLPSALPHYHTNTKPCPRPLLLLP
jgi:hypothetical protein